jgi:nitroreductase
MCPSDETHSVEIAGRLILSTGMDVNSDEFLQLVSHQRACRAFSSEPVTDKQIEYVLSAATYAPSAENTQPWVFVVVEDERRRAAIGDIIRAIWDSFGRQYTQKRSSPALFADVDHGLGAGGVAAAPVLVVVGGDSRVVDRSQLKASVYPAVQNLLLAASWLGLGTCLTTIANIRSDETRDLVGFPDEVDPLALIPIGHPARPLGPPRRESFTVKAHRDRYGAAW